MSRDMDREAVRMRPAYARRAQKGLDARYDFWTPVNLLISRPTDLNGIDLVPERVERARGAQLERLSQRREAPGLHGQALGS